MTKAALMVSRETKYSFTLKPLIDQTRIQNAKKVSCPCSCLNDINTLVKMSPVTKSLSFCVRIKCEMNHFPSGTEMLKIANLLNDRDLVN